MSSVSWGLPNCHLLARRLSWATDLCAHPTAYLTSPLGSLEGIIHINMSKWSSLFHTSCKNNVFLPHPINKTTTELFVQIPNPLNTSFSSSLNPSHSLFRYTDNTDLKSIHFFTSQPLQPELKLLSSYSRSPCFYAFSPSKAFHKTRQLFTKSDVISR